MKVISRLELAEDLVETLARLASDGEPVRIEDVAVIISAEEYRFLRQLEDRLDLAEMAKVKAESEGTLSYQAARKELEH